MALRKRPAALTCVFAALTGCLLSQIASRHADAMGRRKRNSVPIEKRTFVTHARQQTVPPEKIVADALGRAGAFPNNPVMRLQISYGMVAGQDELRATLREAINELRVHGWTLEEIGTLVGASRQRVWQLATSS